MNLQTYANFKITIIIIFILRLEVETRKFHLKQDKLPPPRDYRPSKWVANSALDVWYGNKSMVDILSREFTDMMNKIALRPVRSLYNHEQTTYNSSEIYLKEQVNRTFQEINKTMFIEKSIPN